VSADVLSFPTLATQNESDIPMPLYYQAGDEYVRLNVLTDELTEAAFHRGAVAIVLRDFVLSGALHLLYLSGEPTVLPVFQTRHGKLCVRAHADDPQPIPAHEIEIVGCVSEFYPIGLSGPRLVTHRPDRAHLLVSVGYEYAMRYPLASAVAN
jgi:hypothetical protein